MTTPSPSTPARLHSHGHSHTPRLQTTRRLSRCSRTTSSPLPPSTVTPRCAAVGQPYACPLHPTAQNEAPRTRCQFAQADLVPRPRRHRPTVRWMRRRGASMARPPATVVTSARGLRTARLRPWSRRREGDRVAVHSLERRGAAFRGQDVYINCSRVGAFGHSSLHRARARPRGTACVSRIR